MSILAVIIVVTLFVVAFRFVWKKDDWKKPNTSFPVKWRKIVQNKIAFYGALSTDEKTRFEYKIQEFLLNYRITGISTSINIEDKLLVAASAIIPIFEFPKWRYSDLHEVLLYPDSFNENFETSGKDRRILGMVGTGYMNNTMILSKRALHHGFSNESDKKNTAIHEFVHLIDKSDGSIDGIPSVLLDKQFSIPWLDLINKKIEDIYAKKSDINPYGGTNKTEFFAVASEYFFERPKLLAQKHPELYNLLEEVFDQSLQKKNFSVRKNTIGRNDTCPCGSGLKFKKCCGKSGL